MRIVARTCVRSSPIEAATACHADARSKPSGRIGGQIGDDGGSDPADAERPRPRHRCGRADTRRCPSTPGRADARFAADTCWVAIPVARASIWRRSITARSSSGRSSGRERRCAGSPSGRDRRPRPSLRLRRRRGTFRGAPARACAARSWPRGRPMRMRPRRRNSARASSAVSPLRSVRAPPSSCQPPPRPACEYTGNPAALSASRSRRAVFSDTSSSVASSRAVTSTPGLQHQQRGDESAGTHGCHDVHQNWSSI